VFLVLKTSFFKRVFSYLDTYRNNKFLFLQFTLRLKHWCDWFCKVNEPLKILAQKNTLCYCLSYHTKTNLHRGFLYSRSEEHTSELQSRFDLVCRLLLEK